MESKALTRRGLFAGLVTAVADQFAETAQATLDAIQGATRDAVRTVRFERPVLPPGAPSLERFRELCTRCDDCIRACPPMVIRKAGAELGAHDGYPMLLPHEGPCKLCETLPCITACPTGALTPVPRAETRIGTAAIDPAACYAAQGQPCDYCVKACPVRPRAIRLAAGGPPEVLSEICTGCGECAWLCPPGAIRVAGLTG